MKYTCPVCGQTWEPVREGVHAAWSNTIVTRYPTLDGWYTCNCGHGTYFKFDEQHDVVLTTNSIEPYVLTESLGGGLYVNKTVFEHTATITGAPV